MFLLALITTLALSPAALAHKAKRNAEVYIENLEDGAVITSPVRIRFGARKIHIAPVGVDIHRSGHHHLLVNVDTLPTMDEMIPFDGHHLHYVNGETEALVELPPGNHSLQLVLGDEEHLPWGEQLVSERITITVTGHDVSRNPSDSNIRLASLLFAE